MIQLLVVLAISLTTTLARAESEEDAGESVRTRYIAINYVSDEIIKPDPVLSKLQKKRFDGKPYEKRSVPGSDVFKVSFKAVRFKCEVVVAVPEDNRPGDFDGIKVLENGCEKNAD